MSPSKKTFCSGKFEAGNKTFHCHNRVGHGNVDLETAMLFSCDVFFYSLGVELGIDRIEKYAKDFYLGRKLGLNLNYERAGLIPSKNGREKIQALSYIR